MGGICSAYFETKDGVRLHYLEAGGGPTLIILPGWTQPAASFQAQLEGLSGEFHCLALDFRAHGDSERPNYGYRLSRLTEDLREFLDHCEVEDITLLGHSAGCAIIWNFIDLFGEGRVHAHIFADQMIAHKDALLVGYTMSAIWRDGDWKGSDRSGRDLGWPQRGGAAQAVPFKRIHAQLS